MASIEFEIERTVQAPIAVVFARLVDIEGYNEWMADNGSMLTRTRKTSPGEPAVGTTYVDETSQGPTPGEIVELQAPHTVGFHWWTRSKAGKLQLEGWPSYSLEAHGENQTLVRHHAKLNAHGVYRLATPILKRLALRERTVTLDALRASFDPRPDSGPQ